MLGIYSVFFSAVPLCSHSDCMESVAVSLWEVRSAIRSVTPKIFSYGNTRSKLERLSRLKSRKMTKNVYQRLLLLIQKVTFRREMVDLETYFQRVTVRSVSTVGHF